MSATKSKLDSMAIGEIAANIPGATALFRQHELDFCCGGNRPLGEAIEEKRLNRQEVIAGLEKLLLEEKSPDYAIPRNTLDYQTLVRFIIERYHETHRRQFPELIMLSERVERVHGKNPHCPRGLASHLSTMFEDLLDHMEKEETILFPLLCRGERSMASGAITMLESEHEDHGRALEAIKAFTNSHTLPERACNTWRALYEGLRSLEDDLINHIHLENNILFSR